MKKCILVTGEIAYGTYDNVTNPITGSLLITNGYTEDGRSFEYAWATEIIKN